MSLKRQSVPHWKRSAIHSAIVFAFSNTVFIGSAAAVSLCPQARTSSETISTTKTETQCPENSSVVSVTSSGSVSVEEAGIAVAFAYESLDGSLDNAGTISATSVGERGAAFGVLVSSSDTLAGSLTNSGTISARVIDGNAYSVGVGVNGLLSGQLTNNGTISARADGGEGGAFGVAVFGDLNGALNNSGTISASVDGGAGVGVYVTGNLSGALNNSGTISAAMNAVYGWATGVQVGTLSGTLTNSGTISAAMNGVYGWATGVQVGTLSGTLTNSGTISAAMNGVYGRAVGVQVSTLDGTLNNSGRITASAPDGQAFSLYIGDGKGSSTGVVNNQVGGYLGGNLYIGDSVARVTNAGTIAIPEPAVGDLQLFRGFISGGYIAGDYQQLAGGRVDLGVSNAASYGSLHVGGTADLRASNLIGVHAKPNNTLLAGDKLTNVLSSDNPLLGVANGTSVSVVGTPLFGFSGAGNAENGIDVTVTSKSTFTGILGKGVANALDGLVTGYSGTGAMDPLLDALYGLDSVDELKDVATRLAPSLSDGMNRTAASVIGDVNRIINSRQFANRGQSSGDSFYGDRYFWFKPFGSYAKQGEHSDVMGYNANSYGLVFGVDGEISDTTRIGGAFAYATSNVDGESSTVKQSGDVDSYLLTAYGSHSLDAVTNVNFQAGYGVQRNDSKRVIAVGGLWALPTSTATADYNGWSANLGVGVERAYAINQSTTFIPSVRADYIKVHNDGYNEKGAGVLNLDVGSSKAESLVLGVDGKFDFAIDETSKITANLGIGYDVLNDQGSVTSAFVGGGGAFTTDGTDQSPWVYRGGLGYVMSKTKSLELSVRYDIEGRSSDFTNQTGSLNLRMPF